MKCFAETGYIAGGIPKMHKEYFVFEIFDNLVQILAHYVIIRLTHCNSKHFTWANIINSLFDIFNRGNIQIEQGREVLALGALGVHPGDLGQKHAGNGGGQLLEGAVELNAYRIDGDRRGAAQSTQQELVGAGVQLVDEDVEENKEGKGKNVLLHGVYAFP